MFFEYRTCSLTAAYRGFVKTTKVTAHPLCAGPHSQSACTKKKSHFFPIKKKQTADKPYCFSNITHNTPYTHFVRRVCSFTERTLRPHFSHPTSSFLSPYVFIPLTLRPHFSHPTFSFTYLQGGWEESRKEKSNQKQRIAGHFFLFSAGGGETSHWYRICVFWFTHTHRPLLPCT